MFTGIVRGFYCVLSRFGLGKAQGMESNIDVVRDFNPCDRE